VTVISEPVQRAPESGGDQQMLSLAPAFADLAAVLMPTSRGAPRG
jgi:hypothetical protein